jgi:hypothetical protein
MQVGSQHNLNQRRSKHRADFSTTGHNFAKTKSIYINFLHTWKIVAKKCLQKVDFIITGFFTPKIYKNFGYSRIF